MVSNIKKWVVRDEMIKESKELLDQLDIALNSGNLESQIEILRQFLSLAQQSGNRIGEIWAMRLLGNAYHDKGQMNKAQSYRVTAAQLINELGPKCPMDLRMSVEGDLGRSYMEIGDWPRAEAYTNNALRMAESIQDLRSQCIFKMNLGGIYANVGRMEQAHQLASEVLRAAENLQDHYILGLQHLNLAQILLKEHRLNECQRHASEGMKHAGLSGNEILKTFAHSTFGNCYRIALEVTGRPEYSYSTEDHLRQAEELSQRLGDVSFEAKTEVDLACHFESRQLPNEAANHYHRAMELLEDVRSSLGYEEFQLRYFKFLQPTYEKFIEFLLRQGQVDQAFLNAERLRSRLLLAILGQGRINTDSWLNTNQKKLTELLDIYGSDVMLQHFGKDLRGLSRDIAGSRSMGKCEITSDTMAVPNARQNILSFCESQRLNRTSWKSWQSQPTIDFKDSQRLLGQEDALLSYLVTDESIIIFVATNESRHFQHLSYPLEKITSDVNEVCLALSDVQEKILDPFTAKDWFTRKSADPWPDAINEPMARLLRSLDKLYALLVAPILSVVNQKTHWIIIPNGPLHRIPWAALHKANRYLIEEHSISLLPSCSFGAALEAFHPLSTGRALFFADPDNDDEELKLPGSQLEVLAGYRLFQAGPPPFIGLEASKSNFLKFAPTARLLHLACHSFFDAGAPVLSFLKFAGSKGSNFLYAFEIAEMNLSAELVSLSSCQSGLSGIETGDEQFGMVRAFLAAGASSVISTLWSIEDDSALAFFGHFYENAYKYGSGRALAEAQRNLMADPRYELPCFWASYVLTGQWKRSIAFDNSI